MGAVDRVDGVEIASVKSVTKSESMANSSSGAIRLARPRNSTAMLDDAPGLGREAADQGYLFFRRLVPVAEVLDLRARVLDVCREIGWLDDRVPIAHGVVRSAAQIGAYDDIWTSLQCRVLPLPEFGRLREHPTITAILTAIFHGPFLCERGDTCRVFSPASRKLTTPPHQDHFYVRGDTALWTVWFPLGDCPLELGGLAVLPGSHHAGLRPHRDENADKQGIDVGPDFVWVSANYRCGDVLMFNSLTVHRALENRTPDCLRISVDFRYQPVEDPENPCGLR